MFSSIVGVILTACYPFSSDVILTTCSFSFPCRHPDEFLSSIACRHPGLTLSSITCLPPG
jgi:hypothetical protein